MLEWLERDLALTRKFWRIVFFHHPGYASGEHENEPEGARVREFLTPIFERHAVQLVLNGHEHSYQRTVAMTGHRPQRPGVRGCIVTITSGGGGAAPYVVPPRPHTRVASSSNHYLRGTVEGGSLSVSAIEGTTGAEIDTLTLTPEPRLTGHILESVSYSTRIAQGGLVTVLGHQLCPASVTAEREPLPLELGGVTVTVQDRLVPILYASPTQLNLRLPFEVIGRTEITVTTASGSETGELEVLPIAPVLFRMPGPRADGVLATHLDGRPVTNSLPAAAQEGIVLWASGLGLPAGSVAPSRTAPGAEMPISRTVDVLFGDLRVTANSVVLAAGYLGIYQLRVSVPDLRPGRVGVSLTADGVSSNDLFLAVS